MDHAPIPTSSQSDVAIIGMAGRFPGAANVDEFWDNLCHAVESVRTLSESDLLAAGVSAAQLKNPNYVRAGVPLAHVDLFDAGFFGINPKEAAIMDPQQRLFLECAWEALEHAGHPAGASEGAIGVFAGSGPNSYLFYNLLSNRELVEAEGIFALRHGGNDKDVLATRVSYQLNLHGPSINVQTACSTSLVAVHLACQSLLNGECDLALAGAVSIEIPQGAGYLYREGEILARDGHCRAFDAQATGTVFGSGLGLVVLRRLADAVESGDSIYAVIKGSAINNDGGRKVGYLAPSIEGQVDAVSEALAVAGVDGATIDYIEAHGTGTVIGDPIELTALGQVFGGRPRPLHIGSVKTNIGHLDTASGIAGLIKTALALSRRRIPPTLHFTKPNPLIDFDKARLQVVHQLMDWPEAGGVRRAGITSLGIGGSNAHVVLEAAPAAAPAGPSRDWQLLTLSAKSATALEGATKNLTRYMERHAGLNLGDAAYTLHLGRNAFAHRRVVVCKDASEAQASLGTLDAHWVATGEARTKDLAVAFMFSGQGSQYVHMGRTLYAAEPVFRQWMDACASAATPLLGLDIRSVLYPPAEGVSTAIEQIRQTWITQPALFALEYALAQLWMSWGIRPARLLGHSIGEYVAACLAGVFSFEDAVAAVAARGLLMRELSGGAMLAVAQSEAEIRPLLSEKVSLAAVNGPGQCVVSGSVEDIEKIEQKLGAGGVPAKRLQTSHAFHSHFMDPVLEPFTKVLRPMRLGAPRIPVLSNFTGTWLTEGEATDPRYWAKHLRQTVRFQDGLDVLLSEPNTILLEVGPAETLTSLAKRHPRRNTRQKLLSSLPAAAESGRDTVTMLSTLGQLWLNGVEVDWKGFHAHERRSRIPLPTYPFERRRFWMGPAPAPTPVVEAPRAIDQWFYRVVWKPTPATAAEDDAGPWLIFCDAAGAGQDLAGRLRQRGQEVTTVTIGSEIRGPRGGSFSINPSSAADYAALFRTIPAWQWPRKLIYLWPLEKAAPFRDSEELAFYGLLSLLQQLGRRPGEHPIRVGVVTQGAVSVNGEPVLHPAQATVTGPCRVAPKEYANLFCRQIDVDAVDPELLARIALAEMSSDAGETVVAYRNNARWAESVERSSLESGPSRLRERGVYLITGGLGGLGLASARWLAHTCKARLVLVSRDAQARMPRCQTEIKEMERDGAEVLVRSADVTDLKAMRQVLEEAQGRFGPLQGVLHAAGFLDDGVIELKKQERAEHVLAPKLQGTRVLNKLLQDTPLDFFAMFSSVSAVWPPAGQVDYCSANAYLNAFAQSCPPARNMIAIGWSAWGEVGMAAAGKESKTAFSPPHPLIESLDLDTEAQTVCSGSLSLERHWILKEHRVHGGDALLVGTGHLELAVAALWRKIGRQPLLLRDVLFLEPLLVNGASPLEFRGELRRTGSAYRFSTTSGTTLFASGEIGAAPGRGKTLDLKAVAQRCPREVASPRNVRQEHYFDFGPRWRSVRRLTLGQEECLAELELPAEFSGEVKDFALHPALLDMATGIALLLIPGYDSPGEIDLPFSYKQATVYRSLPARVFSHARIRRAVSSDVAAFDITITDPDGAVVMEIEEFSVKRITNPAETLLHRPGPNSVAPVRRAGSAPERRGMETRDGIQALQKILHSSTRGVIFVSPDSPAPMAQPATAAPPSARTSFQGDVENALKDMWQRLLGVEDAALEADFFQLGGHSLIAVRLFSEIRARFQVDLGLATLFEARTLGALAGRIREERRKRSGGPTGKLHCVVPIRTGGSRTPFFIIHGVGGNLLNYEPLVRNMDPDQPVYGVQSRGLGGLLPDTSVGQMAARYIEEIRQIQPEGPYLVGGHSFGGLVAYEIGCQLAANGRFVGLVALIDAEQRTISENGFWPSFVNSVSSLCRRIKGHTRQLVMGPDRMGYLGVRATGMRQRVERFFYLIRFRRSQRAGQNVPVNLQNVEKANWLAFHDFTPRPYDGSVVLFRSTTRAVGDLPDYLMGWRHLARSGVQVQEIPGAHLSLLREPHVRVLAEKLGACLWNASGGSPSLGLPKSPESMLASHVSI